MRRILTPAILVLLTGCGAHPSLTPSMATRSNAMTVQPDTHRWQMRMPTATGNRLDLDFTMPKFDVQRGLDPDGRVLLKYTDVTGFFGTRDTIYAYMRIVMESGEVIEKQQARMSRMKGFEGDPVAFRLDERFLQALTNDNPLSVEFAFFGADRYGALQWDSNDGKNYLFDLDTFPIPLNS